MTTDLSHTLRALSTLLRYPDDELLRLMPDVRGVLHATRCLGRPTLQRLDSLVLELLAGDSFDTQAAYVQLFDGGRSTSLHLFEHVLGDSRERGSAMIDLVRTYEAGGVLLADGELPDHLCVALEFASQLPPEQARAFVSEFAHIVNAIGRALQRQQSAYAAVLDAVLEIAGEVPRPVDAAPEPALDDAWREPPAFAGCDSAGQGTPGQTQPVHFVRQRTTPNSTTQGARP